MSAWLTGEKELFAKLKELADQTTPKAAAAGTRAALREMAIAARTAVNASGASGRLKAAARKTIGQRFLKGGTSRVGKVTKPVAKVGFAVGIKAEKIAKGQKKRLAKALKHGKTKTQGVGIGARNIHWAVLGTGERYAGVQTRKKHFHKLTGKPIRYTGTMPALFKGRLAPAVMGAQTRIFDAFAKAADKVIQKDAQKGA